VLNKDGNDMPCINQDWCFCEENYYRLPQKSKNKLNCDYAAIDPNVPSPTSTLKLVKDLCLVKAEQDVVGCYSDADPQREVTFRSALASTAPACASLVSANKGNPCACLESFALLTASQREIFSCNLWDSTNDRPIRDALGNPMAFADENFNSPISFKQGVELQCEKIGGMDTYIEERNARNGMLKARGKNDPVATVASIISMTVAMNDTTAGLPTGSKLDDFKTKIATDIYKAVVFQADGVTVKTMNVTLDDGSTKIVKMDETVNADTTVAGKTIPNAIGAVTVAAATIRETSTDPTTGLRRSRVLKLLWDDYQSPA
jgi:hypothetical protein